MSGYVIIHPVFNQCFLTTEHPEGQLEYLGDAIGRDFMVAKFFNGFLRPYLNDGKRNEDWFSYKADVLAPCEAIVEKIQINSVENTPGSHTNKPAQCIVFRRKDDVRIAYAHVMDIHVEVNDKVEAGQIIAKCGNNGTSWNPHIHVGAWKGDEPLQIIVDLQAYGKIEKEQGDRFIFLEDDEESKRKVKEGFKR